MKNLKIFCLFLLVLPLMILPSFAVSDSVLDAAFGEHAGDVTVRGSEGGAVVGDQESLGGSFSLGYEMTTSDGTTGYSTDSSKAAAEALKAQLDAAGIPYRVDYRSEDAVDISCNNGYTMTKVVYMDIIILEKETEEVEIPELPEEESDGDEGGDEGDGDDEGDDEEESCYHWIGSHQCISQPSNKGTPAAQDIYMPFNYGSLTPDSENNPLMESSSFSINGIKQHVERRGSNPDMKPHSVTCGKSLYSQCSLNISSHEIYCGKCPVSYSYIDYGEPLYVDYYNAVNITFKGFRVGASRSQSDTKGSTTSTSNRGSRPSLGNINYSPSYTITDLVDSELEEVSNGLFKGSVTVACSCGCGSNVFPMYFKITDPEEPEPEKYQLNLIAVTISENESDFNAGSVAIGDEDFGEQVSKEFMIDQHHDIKAKVNVGYEDNYEFKGWYEPNEDYYKGKRDWYGDDSLEDENANTSISMPGYNYTLIALFAPKKVETYKVYVKTDENGTVEIGEQIGTVVEVEVIAGETIEIKANPYKDDKYEFIVKEWLEKDDGEYRGINSGTDINKLSLTVNRDYYIIVYFKCDTGYTLTINVNDGKYDGDILKGYTTPEGTIDAVPGKIYSFGAYPNQKEGYDFYSWTAQEGDKYVANSKLGQFDSIEMPEADVTLSANIVKGSWDIKQVVVKSAGGGYVGIDDGDFAEYESVTVGGNINVKIKAMPKEDFVFKYWEDENGNIIDKSECLYENGIYIYEVTESIDKEYVAYFEYTGVGFRLSVESAGGGDAIGTVNNAKPGERYRIKAIPYSEYKFDYWEDDWGDYLGSREEKWIVMEERDYTVTAYFEEKETRVEEYDLTVEKIGSGTTNPYGTNTYLRGKIVALSADPASGYEFDGWYEDNKLLSKSPSYSIKMYRDRKIIARFVKINEKSISAFKVLSIRDLSWKDYFTSVNTELSNYLTIPWMANANTVLVNDAQLVENRSDRRVKFGYAVECELETWDIECGDVGHVGEISKSDMIASTTELRVGVSIPGASTSLGDYGVVSSKSQDSIDKFMITATKDYRTVNAGGTTIHRPVIKWRWVYYLPIDFEVAGTEVVDEDFTDDLTVKFDIQVRVKTDNGDYISYKYNLARQITENGTWGGKVFTYRTDKTLLDDIDNDAIN